MLNSADVNGTACYRLKRLLKEVVTTSKCKSWLLQTFCFDPDLMFSVLQMR